MANECSAARGGIRQSGSGGTGNRGGIGLASTRDNRFWRLCPKLDQEIPSRLKKWRTELAKQYPLDTIVNSYWLPTIRAGIEINRHNPAKAIETLQVAAPYEMGLATAWPGSRGVPVSRLCARPGLFTPEQRKRSRSRISEISDHRGIVVNCPLGALANLGLARAYASRATERRRVSAYQDFFAAVERCRSRYSHLRQAKSEYAKLK